MHDLAFALEAAVTGTSGEATRQHVSSGAVAEGSPIDSLAVLPFENVASSACCAA
jgi:hypothetical protein